MSRDKTKRRFDTMDEKRKEEEILELTADEIDKLVFEE